MFLFKTFIQHSHIEGVGCFTAEPIQEGEVVWRFDPAVDLTYTEEDLKKFPDSFLNFLEIYAYTPLDSPFKTFILCADHARHMNHSIDPNLIESPDGSNRAVRDIAKGEELTCNYIQFDKNAFNKLHK